MWISKKIFFIFLCLFLAKQNFILFSKGFFSERTPIDQGYIFSLRHYPTFFGDDNNIDGPLFDRSCLLGSFNEWRNFFVDHGIYMDTSIFQFLGINTTGGADDGHLRYNGNAEYWFILDTGKMGLWSKGVFMLRGETSWTVKDSINDDVGSILAANARSRVPVPDNSNSKLSEIAFAQFITDKFVFRIGKLDATGPLESTEFANNSRYQFLYAGLGNNPIINSFAKYTAWSFLPTIIFNKQHQLLLYVGDADGNADTIGFKTAFNGNANFCMQYTYSPTFGRNLTGNYRIIGTYSKKDLTQYEIDERHLIGEDIGSITIPEKNKNYAVLCNFDQYIWKNKNKNIPHRNHLPAAGILLFGRAGWAPNDRNVIDQFYSIGIGGYGGPFKRYYDQWGIGYAATHISAELRADLLAQNVSFNTFEHAAEIFYDMQLTPAIHWSLNAQIIRPPLHTRSAAFVIQTRLRAEF